MNFLYKLYFFNTVQSGPKAELFISSSAIDLLTWFKKDETKEGTQIHSNIGKNVNHVIEGLPENVNQIAFDGLFFKCTAHYVAEKGAMKKYTAWLNPDNILCIYTQLPGDCIVFFKSGFSLIIANRLQDVMKSLLEHNKKYKERKNQKYGK